MHASKWWCPFCFFHHELDPTDPLFWEILCCRDTLSISYTLQISNDSHSMLMTASWTGHDIHGPRKVHVLCWEMCSNRTIGLPTLQTSWSTRQCSDLGKRSKATLCYTHQNYQRPWKITKVDPMVRLYQVYWNHKACHTWIGSVWTFSVSISKPTRIINSIL